MNKSFLELIDLCNPYFRYLSVIYKEGSSDDIYNRSKIIEWRAGTYTESGDPYEGNQMYGIGKTPEEALSHLLEGIEKGKAARQSRLDKQNSLL